MPVSWSLTLLLWLGLKQPGDDSPVEPAVHEESNCQYDEAGQESECASPLPLVDQVITENRQDQ